MSSPPRASAPPVELEPVVNRPLITLAVGLPLLAATALGALALSSALRDGPGTQQVARLSEPMPPPDESRPRASVVVGKAKPAVAPEPPEPEEPRPVAVRVVVRPRVPDRPPAPKVLVERRAARQPERVERPAPTLPARLPQRGAGELLALLDHVPELSLEAVEG